MIERNRIQLDLLRFVLLLLFMLLSLVGISQYSRSIYATIGPGASRSSTIIDVNGQTYFASIKKSYDDTISLVAGHIDKNGETSNYVQQELSGFNFSLTNFAISGSGSIAQNNALISVITSFSGIATMHYLRFEISSGIIINEFTLPIDFSGPFAQTQQKGDSLVTYITLESGDFVRISASINNPTQYTQQIVFPGVTAVGSLNSSSRFSAFKVDDAGNEIACAGNVLIKRTNAGNISSTTIPGFLTQEIYGQTLAVNNNGNIMVISGQKYAFFNNMLTPVVDGTINHPYQVKARFVEIQPEGPDWALYIRNDNRDFEQLKINNSGVVLESIVIGRQSCLPLDIIETGGSKFLMVEKKENQLHYYPANLFSIGIIKLDSSNSSALPSDFIEYGQKLEHQQLIIEIPHLSTSFLGPEYEQGIKYTFNGNKRPVCFSGRTSAIGYDETQNLYADGKDNPPSYTSCWPGPYSDNVDNSPYAYDAYNRGYYVDRSMIDNHIWQIANNNQSYEVPFGIREWPAHGDTQIGQEMDLAPFVDMNNNGVYEPMEGDYPLIYGSKCILNVFHDVTELNKPGLEHLKYYFVFDCDTSDLLNNTFFVNERIIARRGSFNSAYYTHLLESSIGGELDDYMGTNVELGMTYFYNGDSYDDDYTYMGFHDTLPAFGIQILKGAPLANDGIDNFSGGGLPINGYGFNDGIIDNEHSTMESSVNMSWTSLGYLTPEIYNEAQGLYSNGTPVNVNGVDIRFDYFDDTDPLFYASDGVNHGNAHFEAVAGNNPGFRYSIASSDTFGLALDQSIDILSAYIIAIDTNEATFSGYQPVKKLHFMGKMLKEQFAHNQLACGLNFDPYVADYTLNSENLDLDKEIVLFPNPTDGEFMIRSSFTIKECAIYSLSGKLVHSSDVNNEKEIQLDLRNLVPGVYIVSIRSNDTGYNKKLVIL